LTDVLSARKKKKESIMKHLMMIDINQQIQLIERKSNTYLELRYKNLILSIHNSTTPSQINQQKEMHNI